MKKLACAALCLVSVLVLPGCWGCKEEQPVKPEAAQEAPKAPEMPAAPEAQKPVEAPVAPEAPVATPAPVEQEVAK